ncbi:fam11a b protein [Anaeramoeba ignava]|uniref:Fam11a b protein n=1 Tax=Anaeramoeba ignava TaxID=1746090 RepID=A0A9Q0LK49_ANAIG|nr:fam11a b protein [Anaeramoeba ignava]
MNLNQNKPLYYYEIIQIYLHLHYTTFINQIYPTSKANKMINYLEKYTQKNQYEIEEFTNKNVDLYSNINLDFIEKENEIEIENKREIEIEIEKEKKEDENEDYFEWLPEEIILMIFEYFDKPSHLCICEATCSQFQRISNEPILWRNVLRKNAPFLDFLILAGSSYRYQTTVSCYFNFDGVIGICKYFEEEYERLLEQQKEEIYFDKKEEEIEKEKEKEKEKKPITDPNDPNYDPLLDPNNPIYDPFYDQNNDSNDTFYHPNYRYNINPQNKDLKSKLYPKIKHDKYQQYFKENLQTSQEVVDLIENNPKKLIVQQINKFESAYRVIKRDYKFYDSNPNPINSEKIDKALKIFEEGAIPILFSLSFLITIILSMLKLDLIIETNCIYIFIPVEIFLCCLLYIGFCFYLKRTNRHTYHFTISMIISIISTIIFLILLSIKLEYSNSFPWFIILIPHLTSFGAWIYFPVTIYRKIRDEEDYLINIIISYILIFHIPITTFMILFILYKQNISGITQNSIFIPLFIIDILPTALFIFWPIYLRYCRKHTDSWKSVRNLPSSYNSYLKINFISLFIYQIPMLILFIQELLIYLKLNQKIFIEWITVSIPSIITLGGILLFGTILEVKYIKRRHLYGY